VKITLPLTVLIPRKTKDDKVFHLNLNVYRNTHHMTLNQAKIAYKGIVWQAILDAKIPVTSLPAPPFIFHYTVFPANRRAFDIGNVLPIVQKFTDDALIELGLIPDDNYKIIRENVHLFGAVDKENPRVELEIISIS
jgi:hypothetical protein